MTFPLFVVLVLVILLTATYVVRLTTELDKANREIADLEREIGERRRYSR